MSFIDSNVIIALLSCVGTIIGSSFGVLASQKLTRHRLEELEKKVDKHNQVLERTAILEEKVKGIGYRVEKLEQIIE